MDDIKEELEQTLEELDALLVSQKLFLSREGQNAYAALRTDGSPALQPLLVAKAQVLVALAELETPETVSFFGDDEVISINEVQKREPSPIVHFMPPGMDADMEPLCGNQDQRIEVTWLPDPEKITCFRCKREMERRDL